MSTLIELTEEQQSLVKTVGAIAERYGHSYFAERGRAGVHVHELWRDLGQAGFLGVAVPEEFGGGGGGLVEFALVMEELAAHGLPLFMGIVSPGICAPILAAHAQPAMQKEWISDIASGERMMAFGMTEADAGTNSHNIATTARRDGDDWVINGSKTYISGVDQADAILVVARTGVDESTGRGELSMFVVPTDAPGLHKDPIAVQLVSPDRQFMLFFEDVRVPGDALVGSEGKAMRQLFVGLNPERVAVAATACGIGRYSLTKAADYARERTVWSTPIGAHQGIAHPMAESYIELELARMATLRAAALNDAGEDPSEASSIAKFFAADSAVRALDTAIQVHGGNGVTDEYGLADLWFIVRNMRIAPLSREVVLSQVAHSALRLPRSY